MRARTLLGAAVGIAGVTVLARAAGLGRTAVFVQTVGTSCTGDTYQAANALPNVLFEVVAGGALATVVVPVLAAAVGAGDREQVSRTASALLTWTVLVLTPVALLGALLAPVLVRGLAGPDPACGAQAGQVGTDLLRVFMPQVVLYGVALVLGGVLQAHRRFLGPALAPLLSSVVVAAAYLLYAAQDPGPVQALTTTQVLTLSVGTTIGVAVLALSLLVPLRSCGVVLRPTLAFPDGVAGRVRSLAGNGLAGLAAQQVALLVALRLALAQGDEGAVVVFTVATMVFLLPWAVLAVPVATSAFPELSAAYDDGDEAAYAATSSRATRAVLVATLGAAALLVVVAQPVAVLLAAGAPGADGVGELAGAVVAFAPGLVGYGLVALLGRALAARGRSAAAAAAVVAGWAAVALADVVLVTAGVELPVALGLGNTLGMTLAGALLLNGLRRAAGRPSLTGAARTAGAALAAALAATAAGLGAARVLRLDDPLGAGAALVAGAVLGVLVLGVYAAAVRLLNPQDMRVPARG